MRVAVVAGFAPSLIGFRGPLLQVLRAQGHEVFACAAEDDPAVAETLRGWGISYQALPLQRAGLNPLRDRRYQRALRAWLADVKAEVVLAYTHKPVIYAALAAGSLPKPVRVYPLITGLGFAFIGEGLKPRLARWFLTALYRRASRHFSGVFFQNPDDQALFRSMRLVSASTPQRIVRGSGIDLREYSFEPLVASPLASSQLVPSDQPLAPRFLLIARLLADKGIREYVEAARRIKAQHPAAEFHLVGPTDPNPAAIPPAEVDAWRREGLIQYHGGQKDIRPFMRACTVYVLPSYREGTPRTVLEAMATGRAVITTDAPGCRETVFFGGAVAGSEQRVASRQGSEQSSADRPLPSAVSDFVQQGENGFLVPVRSADALVAAMQRFIAQPELAATMGQAGRRLVEQHYDVHKVNRQMLALMGL